MNSESITIERCFSASTSLAVDIGGRGFQAKICASTGIDSANLNRIIKKSGGCSEDMRRKVVVAVNSLIPDFPAKDYESFLSLGRWIIDGNSPDTWKPPLRGAMAPEAIFIIPDGLSRSISPCPEKARPTQRVPVISWVQAGEWQDVVDMYQPGDADQWISTVETSSRNAFALVVHGDSMEPEFAEGDVITVDPDRAHSSGSFVVVRNGDQATFKQLVLDGSSVFLKPLNDRYPVKDMTGVEMRIVGVVVEKRKRY